MMEQISAGTSAFQLQRTAIAQGMRPLRDVALEHVRRGDSKEALAIVESGEDITLVITDLQMPGLGGDGLVEQLRSRMQTAMLPVIILSGSDEHDTEVALTDVALMDEGADDYIRLPIDPPRFLARVKVALRRAGVS